jgi:hypothetical protein
MISSPKFIITPADIAGVVVIGPKLLGGEKLVLSAKNIQGISLKLLAG